MLWSLTSPELGLLIGCPCSTMWYTITTMMKREPSLTQALSNFFSSQHEQNRDLYASGSLWSFRVCTSTLVRLAGMCSSKLRCMRSIIYWRQGPQDGALFLRQGPQSGALLYVHDRSCTSGNTAQVAIPTIGLGIDIRSHPP